jgi:hypothetical protein
MKAKPKKMPPTKRFRCVRLFTRCKASIFSLVLFSERLLSSLAVLSSSLSLSSSSSSSLMFIVDREWTSLSCFPLSILVLVFGGCEYDAGRWRTLPKLAVSSPVLPLPVEFVAGGEGRPELSEAAPGLGGGSGKSGNLLLGVDMEPRKMADNGRDLLEAKERRVVIGKETRQPGRAQVIKEGYWNEKKGLLGGELVVGPQREGTAMATTVSSKMIPSPNQAC